jgi:hypothetical protein
MSGCYSSLLVHVKAVSLLVKWTHCCIHRQALTSKPLPVDLKDVLDDSCKIVNFIKSRHTNSRIFSALCKDIGSFQKTLIHTEVRWLSRGRVLTCLFEFRHEVLMFFENYPFWHSLKFNDHEWLQKLAYLSDIFLKLNYLNLTLQNSTTVTIFQVIDKIESFVKKLKFWMSCI